ncbi:YeiH family protein [Enterovirga rhinocerotis]|uniref:Putative integral membrane protein (TIGR00698 family) n=1 Tax=Enterovirga rhinocerotis TaxID=1339210 RepID=A0A4R7BX83_9HYPH|nr:YeiH family protein [Enterovirga rhinocerotis]TDR90191.1 putative integral membrane protein (TIGR00698 family) [Enterovirga rhinocerotis]
MPSAAALSRIAPGILLCGAVTVVALLVQWLEERIFGHPYVEALVLAILLGTLLRTMWEPDDRWRDGIAYSAKQLLEVAVMLLGASISIELILSAGLGLLAGIAGTVAVVIFASYGLGRLLSLPPRMAVLIACGNSICGNSAIAAVAPVIGAKSHEIASAIAFTAVLGVIVVLALPLLVPLMGLTETQYGIVAGLTVYAVPQVLAATVPVGTIAVQIGTLVKLVRVLMLGPVVVAMTLIGPRFAEGGDAARAKRPGFGRLVPWFILGFLGLAAARSLGLIPDILVGPVREISRALTILSMAALGLGVDVRVLGRVGPSVVATVTGSLLLLVAISLVLVRMLGTA